jgi:hypothetical protein
MKMHEHQIDINKLVHVYVKKQAALNWCSSWDFARNHNKELHLAHSFFGLITCDFFPQL